MGDLNISQLNKQLPEPYQLAYGTSYYVLCLDDE